MKRIDADGNVAGLFTDGNAGTGVPATVVDAEWLNDVQEELCSVIEGSGIVLAPATQNQLLAAIKLLIQSGGVTSIANFSVANNQVAAANVTGATVADVTKYVGARMTYHLTRKSTADGEFNASGVITLWWCPLAATWKISVWEQNEGDDHGVTFSVTTGAGPTYAAQLQYVSTNLSSTGYASTLRISNVQLIKT